MARSTKLRALAALLLLSATPVLADTKPAPTPDAAQASPDAAAVPADPSKVAPDAAPAPSSEQTLVDSMVMRTGEIELPGGKAKVNVGEGFAFLDAKDAKTLLVDIYGNPPDVAADVLGVIVPKNVSVLDEASWFAVLTYEEEGHVSDDDASSINYDELIQQMKTDTAEASKERAKEGYGTMELIGWAQKPSYDQAAHKLYWAKELQFGDSKSHTLNYAIRALGRTGVLQVNIVAGVDQLKDINPQVPGLLKMVDFAKGQTYAEFDSNTDQMAAYGLAGLIAGGVAAKAGLFKGLLVLLLASKKLLIGLIAAFGATIWGGVKWLMGRKNSPSTADTPTTPPENPQ